MSRRFLASLVALVLLLAVGTALAQDNSRRGRKYKSLPQTADVEVTVLRDSSGKPVTNASVIFHPVVNGKPKGTMELKSDDDGKAKLDLLEIGTTVRLQIIAPGFQTYGDEYKIDKQKYAIEVRLKRPQEQYSIYKQHEGDKPAEDKPAPQPKL